MIKKLLLLVILLMVCIPAFGERGNPPRGIGSTGSSDISIAKPYQDCDMFFRPDLDGWSIDNLGEYSPGDPIMWPKSWWTQFDYCQWPSPCLSGFFRSCYSCKSRDFPDWWLFVEAFGEGQCYLDPPPGKVIYRHSAVSYWRTHTPPKWFGSCLGFAISSLLFFDGYLNVWSEFGYSHLSDVLIGNKSRQMINKYQIYQYGDNYLNLNNSARYKMPDETVGDILSMLCSDSLPHSVLSFNDRAYPWGHSVVPYEVVGSGYDYNVYVYDPDCPADIWPFPYFIRFYVGPTWHDWSYGNCQRGWFGYRDIYLEEPSEYYSNNRPTLPASSTASKGQLSRNAAELSQYVHFYLPSTDSVMLESSSGNIGQIRDSLFNTLSDGIHIIPITGTETPPIGYYLPNDVWTIQVSDITDSTFNLSLFTETTVVTYTRYSVDYTEAEKIRYPGNDSTFWIYNLDPTTRSYDVEVISVFPDSEVVCVVQDIDISPDDSACYSITPGSGLQIDNFGVATTYRVGINIAGPDVDTVFFHEGITLPGNSSHQIVPDWRQYGDSLMILADPGMVGVFSETLFVENELGGGYGCDSLFFEPGWNFKSLNVTPPSLSVEDIMASVVSNLSIVKQADGKLYIPGVINTIGDWDLLQSYKINMKTPDTLEVCGDVIPPDTPLNLNVPPRWHWIPYLPNVPISAPTALASLDGCLKMCKNNAGEFYIPGVINTIGSMEPTEGYACHLSCTDTLIYTSGGLSGKIVVSKPQMASHFPFKDQTGDNYAIVVDSVATALNFEVGDEIGVFTPSGLCVGATAWEGSYPMALTAWVDDPQTTANDGYVAGEELYLRVWYKNLSVEKKVEAEYEAGDGNFNTGPFAKLYISGNVGHGELQENKNLTFSLDQNFPNPFNPKTAIRFSAPVSGKVSLKIYNLLGQEVKTLLHEQKTAGEYKVIWDGKDNSGKDVASGIYIYQIKVKDFIETKKMVLMK